MYIELHLLSHQRFNYCCVKKQNTSYLYTLKKKKKRSENRHSFLISVVMFLMNIEEYEGWCPGWIKTRGQSLRVNVCQSHYSDSSNTFSMIKAQLTAGIKQTNVLSQIKFIPLVKKCHFAWQISLKNRCGFNQASFYRPQSFISDDQSMIVWR